MPEIIYTKLDYLAFLLEPILSRDVYFWFYSTLAQSLAAFIGVAGIFAVFRLQVVNDQYRRSIESLRIFMPVVKSKWEYSHYTDDELINHSNQIIEDLKKEIQIKEEEADSNLQKKVYGIETRKRKIEEEKNLLKGLKKRIVGSLGCLFPVFFVSICCLVYVERFVEQPELAMIWLIVVVLSTFFALFDLMKFIIIELEVKKVTVIK